MLYEIHGSQLATPEPVLQTSQVNEMVNNHMCFVLQAFKALT